MPTKQVVNRPLGRPGKVKPVVEEPEDFVVQKLEEVNKPALPKPVDESLLPKTPAAPGYVWVYNRLPADYTIDFDSKPQMFGPNEFKQIPADFAHHICNWSVIQLPASGPPVRVLVLEGKKGYGVSFKSKERPVELIDRSQTDNPLGRGTGGVPTKAKLLHIGQAFE